MASQRLPNYLKSRRKKSGFTQREIAFLLGCNAPGKVTRYERFKGKPSLPTAFSFQVIFGECCSVLLAGVFDEARQKVEKRAQVLLEKLKHHKSDPHLDSKLKLLLKLTNDQ